MYILIEYHQRQTMLNVYILIDLVYNYQRRNFLTFILLYIIIDTLFFVIRSYNLSELDGAFGWSRRLRGVGGPGPGWGSGAHVGSASHLARFGVAVSPRYRRSVKGGSVQSERVIYKNNMDK